MKIKHQRGIGLLELMLSLAIISVLLVMATRYYQVARQGEQVNDAISQVQAIIAAGENWVSGGNEDFNSLNSDGISKLIANGYLPRNAIKNPWHGSTVVRAGDNPNQIRIAMSNVPSKACLDLSSKLNSNTASPDQSPSSHCSDEGGLKRFEAVF